ncbi:glycosyltransferase [Caulobacter sp. CCH9-E1]|uniref:glycosyltransferase n=1 Tax=Caulobacter sp. CCH9-E1 TaxID=1768768 RepID=UPI000833E694|nr:glycosyltransferase [Caulobacter sp. CCH9-E1]
MPKVLFLTKVYPYPPAVAGDAVYSRGVIGALAPFARLTVLCGSNGSDERTSAEAPADWRIVEPPRKRQSGSILSSWPSIVWRGDTPSHRRELDGLLKQSWDAIILDNIGSAHALPAVKAYKVRHPATTLVYVSHEIEFETRRAKYGKYKINPLVRLASFWDLAKVKSAENRLLGETDIVTVINQLDVPVFQALAPDQRYVLVSPGYDGSVLEHRRIEAATPRRIALLGGRTSQQKQQILLDWLEASYDALVAAEIEVVVIGDVAPGLHDLVQQRYSRVKLLGFVDDADPLLADCRMGIVPDTMGGGFKLRQLTYVFRRVPMVGLDQAISGLPTPVGEGYLAAPDLKALAHLIVTSIDDIDTLNAVQERCFADCAGAFGWRTRGELFAGLLRPAAEQARHEILEVG